MYFVRFAHKQPLFPEEFKPDSLRNRSIMFPEDKKLNLLYCLKILYASKSSLSLLLLPLLSHNIASC